MSYFAYRRYIRGLLAIDAIVSRTSTVFDRLRDKKLNTSEIGQLHVLLHVRFRLVGLFKRPTRMLTFFSFFSKKNKTDKRNIYVRTVIYITCLRSKKRKDKKKQKQQKKNRKDKMNQEATGVREKKTNVKEIKKQKDEQKSKHEEKKKETITRRKTSYKS